jgi:hypothetical protein
MEEPKTRKPTPGVHDEDLDLGYILHHADAPHLGAHPHVSELLTPKAKLVGRGQQAPALLRTQVGGGGSSATDANNSGGLRSAPITGESSTSGVPTDTGVGIQRTNSAGVDSDAAQARKQ